MGGTLWVWGRWAAPDWEETVKLTVANCVGRAEVLGAEHGAIAGALTVNAGADRRELLAIAANYPDSDSAWWAWFGPVYAPLSGAWSDAATPQGVAVAVGLDAAEDRGDEDLDLGAVCDAYEAGWHDAYMMAAQTRARALLDGAQ